MGYVYILHFDKPISDRHTTQHYVGYATDLDARIAEHRNGTGARLTQVAKERGIGFVVARSFKGTRKDERALKNKKNTRLYCPICRANHTE